MFREDKQIHTADTKTIVFLYIVYWDFNDFNDRYLAQKWANPS